MKPSKKENIPTSSKKDEKDNHTAPKIQSYFKSAPKTFVIENNNENGCSSSQAIYIEALKKKLQGMRAVTGNKDNSEEDQLSGAIGKEVNSEEDQLSEVIDAAAVMMPQNDQNRHHGDIAAVCTRDECVQKNVECDEWKRKYKELKRVYMKLMQHSTDRDMKYEDLLKLATTSKPLNTDEGASSEGGIFTPKEIKALGYVAPDKPKDSTFILECLQYAYKSDLSVLRQKTLKGYADWVEISEDGQEIHHPGKEGLTPEKVECIKKLFINRISNLHLDPVSFGERIKETNINKLFASGIKNISKKKLKGEN